jgi:hypothetical protein
MTYKKKSILLWVLSFILMLVSAYYQRTTGPTYPKKGKVVISGETINFKLIRTWDTGSDAGVAVEITNTAITGKYRYKRYKSFDEWTEKPMLRKEEELVAYLPGLPAAGKVMYEIYLGDGVKYTKLTEEPLVLRYKGAVPLFILIPHIILIFVAMMFSMRALFEAFTKGKNLVNYALWTVILLTVGGMIFGPIVQKYAFDAFWTGWPFGTDLTDNKMLVAFLLWVVAYFMVRKNPEKRGWVIAAAAVLLLIYLIPHSMFGSEIDYTKQ